MSVGNGEAIRAHMVMLGTATLLFAPILAFGISFFGAEVTGYVSPLGVSLIVGAFIFGIGMVLAGGCASGVLMRIGEGHALHWVVLIGFIIGTILGAKDYSFWYEHFIKDAKTIYFLEHFDLKIVVLAQIVVLIILYKLALRYENRQLK